MASRRQRFNDEAAAAALVRYGPELSGLRALIGEADQDYRRSLHQSQAGQASTQRAVATAMGQLRGIYGDAPIPGLAGLGRTQAMENMTERGLLAAERSQSARTSALEILRGDRAKIAGRRSDIAQEIGAFTASEAGKLSQAAAERSLRNRIDLRGIESRETEGAKNRQNARTVAEIRKPTAKPKTSGVKAADAFEAKYGIKPQTRIQHNALRSKVDSAAAIVRDQIGKGNKDRRQLATWLTVGRPARTVEASNGTKVKIPGISKVDPFVASMALDVVFNKHVSGRNAGEAHRRGYSVGGLGLPGSRPASRRRVSTRSPGTRNERA